MGVCQKEPRLFDILARQGEIPRIVFDRTLPKGVLWESLNAMALEGCISYRLNLEWSLNIPVAYRSTGACASIEVLHGSGIDPTLMQLPKQHVYLVEGEVNDYLIELIFTDNN